MDLKKKVDNPLLLQKDMDTTSYPRVPYVRNEEEAAATASSAIGVYARKCELDPWNKPSGNGVHALPPAGQLQTESAYQLASNMEPAFTRQKQRAYTRKEIIEGTLKPDERFVLFFFINCMFQFGLIYCFVRFVRLIWDWALLRGV